MKSFISIHPKRCDNMFVRTYLGRSEQSFKGLLMRPNQPVQLSKSAESTNYSQITLNLQSECEKV